MLYDQDMPKFLWVEACNTIVYVQNKIPHNALGKITLESVFTGSKPEVSHFRIFGSATYCHVPEEKSKKLDKTAEKGYLVGYSKNAKAYKIYIPDSGKIVVWWDVKFMEERAFRKSWEMPSAMQYDPLVQPLQPTEASTSGSLRHKDPGVLSQEEQEDPPTSSGRTSRELRQILRDAEEFFGAPRNEKR